MAFYLQDPQLTKQSFKAKWSKEQKKLRYRVSLQDNLKFEMPSNVHITYNPAQNTGFVHVAATHHKDDTDCKLQQFQKPTLKYIASVHIAAIKDDAYEYDKACAGLVIFEYPSMKCVHEETKIVTLRFPYIAGFLAFREVEFLVDLIRTVRRQRPHIAPIGVILVAGNGVLHYRRCGLATHLSLLVKIPCVGVTKNLLAVDDILPEEMMPRFNSSLTKIGAFSNVYGRSGESIGSALRTHSRADVVYISSGNLISLNSSLKIVMLCLDRHDRYRLPSVLEKCEMMTRRTIREYRFNNVNPYQYSYADEDEKQNASVMRQNAADSNKVGNHASHDNNNNADGKKKKKRQRGKKKKKNVDKPNNE
mmetsp:Transcript_6864/g.10826  ORF Transcript_6864/g.10826 Transcript_6864/m.10826 type:complete len:363 (-) Transcript_6864:207-1295(-)